VRFDWGRLTSSSHFNGTCPMTSFREEYVALRNNSGLSSPHSSHNSEESLRALELDQNSIPRSFARSVTLCKRDDLAHPRHRARSYSSSGFNYREDLVSLTPTNRSAQATLMKYAAPSDRKCNRTYSGTWTWREEPWPYKW